MAGFLQTLMIPSGDKGRYKFIFETIDKEGAGRISFCDLCASLAAVYKSGTGHPISEEYFQKWAGKYQMLTFKDFCVFMYDLEKELRTVFLEIDLNQDGELDLDEMVLFFEKNNIKLSKEKAAEIIKAIVEERGLTISWEMWRDYNEGRFLNNQENIFKYWNDYFFDFTVLSTLKPFPVYSTLPWWKLLLAGGTAGLLSKTLTAPLDRIRICYSVSEKRLRGVKLWVALRRMVRREGVLSLWKGNGTTLLKLIPDTAIRFFVYEELRKGAKDLARADDKSKRLSTAQTFAVGSVAAAISTTILYPLDVVKVRLALSESRKSKGIYDCMLQIFRKEGVRGFFRGLLPSVCGYIPYAALDISTYEFLKHLYKKRNTEQRPGVAVTLVSGILSSIFSICVFYPVSVVRTQMQAETTNARESRVLRTAGRILRHEGVMGFYKGLVPCLLKVAPAVSLSYVIYEETKMALYSL